MSATPIAAAPPAAIRRLTMAETDQMRAEPGRTVLFFITDQCPVGCSHCSVDSRADSPRVTDWPLFEQIVAGIAALARVESVAISGGEPFVERRALPYAVDAFADAGKAVVVFTSGHWAPKERQPAAWIPKVLRRVSTVFLSTDAFHQGTVDQRQFTAAVRIVAEAGCRVAIQALDTGDGIEPARRALEDVFGPLRAEHADLKPIFPMRSGRGADVFAIRRLQGVEQFSPCSLLGSPTIRYDGFAIPCCNEPVTIGQGPAGLRRRVSDAAGVSAALDDFRGDPLLRLISTVGPSGIAALGPFAPLAEDRFENVCGACWKSFEIAQSDPAAGRLVDALTAVRGNGEL
jgi:hypothetical protein